MLLWLVLCDARGDEDAVNFAVVDVVAIVVVVFVVDNVGGMVVVLILVADSRAPFKVEMRLLPLDTCTPRNNRQTRGTRTLRQQR